MFMASVCAGVQKERAPSRKGLFAVSDPVLTVRRHLIRAQRNPLLGSETAFLARRTEVFTTGCSVAALDPSRQPPILRHLCRTRRQHPDRAVSRFLRASLGADFGYTPGEQPP